MKGEMAKMMRLETIKTLSRLCAGRNLRSVVLCLSVSMALLSCSVSYKFNGASIDYA
jgi:hypothetical protein